ncbi:MAG: alpha/beta hydrolase, partial [Desulfovibrio sp.]|jgi:acetyl esterase/lipase|nr:alpha/beta hydrolase [Desulfovibrio sp.]
MKKKPHLSLRPWLRDFHARAAYLTAVGFRQTPTNTREFLARLTARYVTKIPEIADVRDDLAPTGDFSVPLRIYHPDPGEELPVLLFFHGGGHMCGSVTVYDPICRKLAAAARHVVVAADYRLAPENPYPAGVDDALGVVHTVPGLLAERGIRFRNEVSIAGDSAGGALCAAVSRLMQFEPGRRIKRQALIYPSLDYTLSLPSVEENADGYMLQTAKVVWYLDNYFPRGVNRKAVSPLFGEFTDKLPETLVVTAEFCPLRDEGVAYCRKVQEAGVKARQLHLGDMIHAYLNLEDLVPDACAETYEAVAAFLNGKDF